MPSETTSLARSKLAAFLRTTKDLPAHWYAMVYKVNDPNMGHSSSFSKLCGLKASEFRCMMQECGFLEMHGKNGWCFFLHNDFKDFLQNEVQLDFEAELCSPKALGHKYYFYRIGVFSPDESFNCRMQYHEKYSTPAPVLNHQRTELKIFAMDTLQKQNTANTATTGVRRTDEEAEGTASVAGRLTDVARATTDRATRMNTNSIDASAGAGNESIIDDMGNTEVAERTDKADMYACSGIPSETLQSRGTLHSAQLVTRFSYLNGRWHHPACTLLFERKLGSASLCCDKCRAARSLVRRRNLPFLFDKPTSVSDIIPAQTIQQTIANCAEESGSIAGFISSGKANEFVHLLKAVNSSSIDFPYAGALYVLCYCGKCSIPLVEAKPVKRKRSYANIMCSGCHTDERNKKRRLDRRNKLLS